MKILVLGGGGMLGHKVVQQLAARDDVWWTLHGRASDDWLAPVRILSGAHALPNVEVRDLEAVERLVRSVQPDVAINCVGIIKQSSTSDPDSMMTVNAALPHRLANVLATFGARLIHVSTDCVFSGRRGRYTEDDTPDAADLYGQSKAAGEVATDHALTIRTSLIGRELRYHRSLLDWFLAQRGKRIRGFRRAIWSGVTTLHLAQLIDALIHEHPKLAGLYHVSSGHVSKFDLLSELKRRYHLEVEIEPDDDFLCDRSLIGTRFELATGYRCPSLSVMIDDLVADPTPYPVLS